jgi:hypothetical protein
MKSSEPPPLSAAQAALAARMSEKNAAMAGHHPPEARKALFSGSQKNAKFPLKELIKLCRGMSSMLRANINTADALKYYTSGHPSPFVRETLTAVREYIETGQPAWAAFAKSGKFDDKFISLIRAGTDAGQLDQAFESIASRLKKEAEFRSKMRKATMLPSIIIFALIIAGCAMILGHVARMARDARQEDAELVGRFPAEPQVEFVEEQRPARQPPFECDVEGEHDARQLAARGHLAQRTRRLGQGGGREVLVELGDLGALAAEPRLERVDEAADRCGGEHVDDRHRPSPRGAALDPQPRAGGPQRGRAGRCRPHQRDARGTQGLARPARPVLHSPH